MSHWRSPLWVSVLLAFVWGPTATPSPGLFTKQPHDIPTVTALTLEIPFRPPPPSTSLLHTASFSHRIITNTLSKVSKTLCDPFSFMLLQTYRNCLFLRIRFENVNSEAEETAVKQAGRELLWLSIKVASAFTDKFLDSRHKKGAFYSTSCVLESLFFVRHNY